MRAIFYAPIADPDAGVASGVQRMGMLMRQALRVAGIDVHTPRLPRAYEGKGDAAAQRNIRQRAEDAASALLGAIQEGSEPKPDLWFSYHVYYKSPDWIGPKVAQTLGIPYLIAEGSHAPKRAGGPWALGHDGTTRALQAADRLLAMTSFDRFCLDQIAPGRVRDLKPFIDIAPYQARSFSLRDAPHLLAVAMMGNDRKLASYELLANALRTLTDLPLTVTIVGDGKHRAAVDAAMSAVPSVRVAGAVKPDAVPAIMATGDIFAWPGLGEAYGLVFLEAQAAGLPVVACSDRGVPDVVARGETALLSPPGDVAAYAANLRRMVTDRGLRTGFSNAAHKFVLVDRTIEAAAHTLRAVIGELGLK